GAAPGASGAICVASAMPLELARPPALEAICEDSGSTDTGRGAPIRFNSPTMRSGSTIGAPIGEVLASIRTFSFPGIRVTIFSIIFIATPDPGSPRLKLNLKLSERLKPEPKETCVLAACGVGVQDVWPGFSPRVP